MCNCHSYNADTGTRKEALLDYLESISSDGEKTYRKVSIDYCIKEQIQELWNQGVCTSGSCCGHNKQIPSVVCNTVQDAVKAKEILIDIDSSRLWEVTYWGRIII